MAPPLSSSFSRIPASPSLRVLDDIPYRPEMKASMYAHMRSQLFNPNPSRLPRTGSSMSSKGSNTILPNSWRHPSSRRGMISDSTMSRSISSRSDASPSTLVLMGVMTSLVRTSGRSWNSPV